MTKLPKFQFDLTVVLKKGDQTTFIHKNNLDDNVIFFLEEYARMLVANNRQTGFYVWQVYAHNFRFVNSLYRTYLYFQTDLEEYGDADAW